MSTEENTPQHGAWFSMPFPINVDNLFAFKDQCAQSSGALRTADGDTMRASSIVGQQEALCVQSSRASTIYKSHQTCVKGSPTI